MSKRTAEYLKGDFHTPSSTPNNNPNRSLDLWEASKINYLKLAKAVDRLSLDELKDSGFIIGLISLILGTNHNSPIPCRMRTRIIQNISSLLLMKILKQKMLNSYSMRADSPPERSGKKTLFNNHSAI